MPDFKSLVQARLSPLRLTGEKADEVIEEIAGHLELAYSELCGLGVPPLEAERHARAEVADWVRLARDIERSKEQIMKRRIRTLWIPALAGGTVAYTLKALIERFVSHPSAITLSGSYYILSWQWLAVLPFVGALAAYWSERANGSPAERAIAALAPVGAAASLVLVSLFVALFVDADVSVVQKLASSGAWLLIAVLIPSVPILLGAVPFLKAK